MNIVKDGILTGLCPSTLVKCDAPCQVFSFFGGVGVIYSKRFLIAMHTAFEIRMFTNNKSAYLRNKVHSMLS